MKALLLLLLVIATPSRAAGVVYTQQDSARVVAMLTAARRLPQKTNLMLHFARQFLGTPYVAHTLDRDREERLVVNLRELDCTTLIETVTALALCAQRHETTFAAYCQHLKAVRYVGSRVAYTARKHYFTLWIDDNARQDIVTPIEPKATERQPFAATQRVSVNYMSTHSSAYAMLKAHPQWLPEIRNMEKRLTGKTFRYIPRSALKPTAANNKALRRYIKDGDIIAIITAIPGLDTSHIGMAVWRSDGLHMLNASSVHKKVVEETMTLYTYMGRHPKQRGIRLARLASR